MSPSIRLFNMFADISVFERKWEVKGGTDQAHGWPYYTASGKEAGVQKHAVGIPLSM